MPCLQPAARGRCTHGNWAPSSGFARSAPARIDRVSSFNVELEHADWAAANAAFEALEQEASAIVSGTGADISKRTVRRMADMRYVGQGSEITVRLPERLEPEAVREAFETLYRQLFGRIPPNAVIQFMSLRLSFTAPMPGSDGPIELGVSAGARESLKGYRQVFFDQNAGYLEAAVYDRYALSPGSQVAGPAVFEENESTFVVGPGSEVHILKDRTILVHMPR